MLVVGVDVDVNRGKRFLLGSDFGSFLHLDFNNFTRRHSAQQLRLRSSRSLGVYSSSYTCIAYI